MDAAAPAAYALGALLLVGEGVVHVQQFVAMITEAGAVILLATALTLDPGAARGHAGGI
jgi:hypothetical protein